MIDRCTNQNSADFANYQGRGITVCEHWLTFENFFADMGLRPSKKHSIDRIDNDKGYSPENCRWALPVAQCRNTRKTIYLTKDGVTKPLAEWAEILGINYFTLHWRYKQGWSGAKLFQMFAPKTL